MRTNIELDDDLISKAMHYSSKRTKHAAVHEALAEYVTRKEEEKKIRDYRAQVKVIQEKTKHLRFTKSSLDIIRADRNRPT
jgi:Arc/MetJ family transcription regulator